MKSAASKSSLPTERRKPSEPPERRKQQHSAKSSPAREIAPFFSIFYRGVSGGISRVTKSQSRAEGMDKDGGGGEEKGGKSKQGTQTPDMGGRRFTSSDKPPLPSTTKGKAAADGRSGWHKQSSRARSTADLHAAKAAAAAEGKNWREEEKERAGTSEAAGKKKVVSSAPSSPQTGAVRRKWFFGFRGRSQEPCSALQPSPGSAPAPPPPGPSSSSKSNGFGGFPRHFPTNEPTPMLGKREENGPTTAGLSFGQRIRLHKGVRTGKIPVEALMKTHRGSERRQFGKGKGPSGGAGTGRGMGGVYMSADDIRMLNQDPEYIAEALRTLGDEQPRVARSTPKHAAILEDPRLVHERQRRHCLYPEDVYDKMVEESLLVCDLLQTHLDECIAGVRAKSPTALSSPFTTPPGSPFMTRSTSMQPFHGAPGTPKPISRVTISVSPMAQQALGVPSSSSGSDQLPPPPPITNNHTSAALPPFPIGRLSPPQLRVTRPSFPSFGPNHSLLTSPAQPVEKGRLRPFAS